jgi:uncharacterized protein with FMN-binding domain
MRRIVWWGLSTFSALVLLFSYSTSTSGPAATTTTPAFVSGTSAATPSRNGQSRAGTKPSAGSGAQPSTPAARTVTGEVARTQWGPVQVELTVSGATIAKVSVLQYPDGNGTDQQISNYALPILIQETMDAQSSQIDMVSGATYTSNGYLQSLQSALDQAGV